MKVYINDKYGKALIKVLRIDGSPAVEGEDFIRWQEHHHKNGKQVYTDGGVALKEGILIVKRCK